MREVKQEAKARARERAGRGRDLVQTPRRVRGRPSLPWKRVLGIAVAAVVVGAAGFINFHPLGSSVARGGATPPLYPTTTATATPTASASAVAEVVPANPFAGTPVEDWSEGRAGVVAPRAGSVGSYSKPQVRTALARTGDLVVAMLIDENVVFRGRTDRPLKKLDRPSEDWVREVLARGKGATWFFNRFDPSLVRPDGHVVKVNGSMQPSMHGRYLAVRYVYVTVFAVRGVQDPKASRLVSIRRSGALWFTSDPVTGGVSRPFLRGGPYLNSGGQCGDKRDRDFLRVHFDKGTVPVEPTATSTSTFNPLDLSKDPKTIKDCYTDTSGL